MMRNRSLEQLDKVIKIKITGSNVQNYLKRIIKRGVLIIKVIPISSREIELILKYKEYEKILSYKSIYDISILNYMGNLRIREIIKDNFWLWSFLILGICLICFLSRVIFDVEVIHQDKKVRELIINELNYYDVKKYSFKKTYDELEKIEDEILKKNKKALEWIEITSYGTKYIVRIEERLVNDEEEEFRYQNIVSKKNAILVRVDAIKGEKVKRENEYVRKGEVIISGNVTLPDNSTVKTSASGKVLGEVWYNVEIDYPFVYQESILTGRTKTLYTINFLGKKISLFDFDEYHSFESKNKVLVSSNLLNICLVREKHYEMIVKDEVYTEDIVRSKAIDYIKEKMKRNNAAIVSFKEVKILSSSSDEDSIHFYLFVKAIEDIGEEAEMKDETYELES